MKTTIIIVLAVCLVGFGAYTFLGNSKNNNAVKNGGEQQSTSNEATKRAGDETSVIGSDDWGNPDAEIVYYYGKECPHCVEVNKFLNENDIYNKVDFAKKEIWHNKKNSKELYESAQKCGIDPTKIGVPFLFNNGKCYIGGPKVEAFFSEKAGL